MGLLTFKGGVHPYDGKALSKNSPIQPLNPQNELVYLVSQHIGAPAKINVKKDDAVKVGDILGIADEKALGVSVHSSVKGKVLEANDSFVIIDAE